MRDFKKKERSMGNHGKLQSPSLSKRLQDDIKIERYVHGFNLYSTFIQKFLVLQKGCHYVQNFI